MARVPLRDVVLTDQFRGAVRSTGSFYVYYPGSSTAAVVYGDAAGSTVVVQPVPYNDYVGQVGFVDPGEYTLSANQYTQNIDATAGDAASAAVVTSPFADPVTSAQNFPYDWINSASVTRTSQLAAFVKVTPAAKLSAVAKVVTLSSGTAAGTITKTYVGLYTSDGTTLTRVALNATNDTSGLWDSTNTAYRQAVTPTTNVLYPGQTYYVGLLVNATTAGTLFGKVKVASTPAIASTELSSPPMYTLATQTSLPTTKAISALTAAYDLVPWVALTA